MSLLRYLLKRILGSIPLLFGLVTIVFFLSRALPGNVTDVFVAPTVPQAVREQMKTQLGLDKPVFEQYLAWLGAVLTGDLGMSFTRNAPVAEVIGNVFPNTVLLGVAALILEIVLAISLAVPVFLMKRTWLEKVLSNGLLVVYSLPSFWVGIMLLIVFSYGLGLLPSSQMYTSGSPASFPDLLRHLILPACTAAIPAAAGLARYLRSNVLSVMRQEYVLHAESMGLSRSTVFGLYVLPGAITPAVSLLGVEIGVLLTGVLVTEVLFSWPGMGQLTVMAIFSRDYPLVLGCALVSGIVVIGGNVVSDLVNAIVDPRIRNPG